MVHITFFFFGLVPRAMGKRHVSKHGWMHGMWHALYWKPSRCVGCTPYGKNFRRRLLAPFFQCFLFPFSFHVFRCFLLFCRVSVMSIFEHKHWEEYHFGIRQTRMSVSCRSYRLDYRLRL